ncbi:MAG TPA: hypothetical protein VHT71_08375 [Methylomirabilota bacterium]|nr:hypothetical protein [Methylomirabilota bacterium]
MLRPPLAGPPVTASHVFERLVAASDRWRVGDRTFAPEFCIGHTRLLADVGRYLPRGSDGTIAGWSARLSAMLGGQAFGLVVDDYHVLDTPLWTRLSQFVCGLYAHTGLPGEQAKAALFLGNYHRTPFGLHRGRSSNFMFVVEGVKRIRAWPDAFFRGKEDLTNRLDYERYNAASVVLQGKPGEVIYWPSPYWHVGEDAGGLSVAISLALFMEAEPWTDVVLAVQDGLARRLRSRARRAALGPAATTRSLGALRSALADPALEQMLVAARLRHLTGHGFVRVPPAAPPRRLSDREIVRADATALIRWARAGRQAVCSANGLAFVVPFEAGLPRLLDSLSSGRAIRVGELLAAAQGRTGARRGPRTALRRVLERLLAFRALVVEPSEDTAG